MSNPMLRQQARTYADQLKSVEWQRFREAALSHHGAKCCLCEAGRGVQVHHMGYKGRRLAWEYEMQDVRIYCADCHEVVTRVSDDIWNECQKLLPHQLESILKAIRFGEFAALRRSHD